MFRFTIRDVLWLTVVVALVVGWCVDRANQAKHNRAMQFLQAKIETERAQLANDLARVRLKALRDMELQGKIILPSGPIR